MAFVISIINTKGGVGKTTLAINLAEAYFRDGERTLLVDHDYRQGTATQWRKRAEERGRDSATVTMSESDLPRLLQDVRTAYDVVIVDGPGYLDKATAALVASSDLVLVPIQPSALDLWACGDLLDWIEQRQMITGGSPEARFVLSRCHPDDRVTRAETEAISRKGITTLSSRTVQRVNYARTLATGGTVLDLPEDDKARRELLSIYGETNNVRHHHQG